MSRATFRCNPVDVYSVFELPAWVAAERAAGRLPAAGDVTVSVIHPDREMDGSCRWCGGRIEEEVVVRDRSLG